MSEKDPLKDLVGKVRFPKSEKPNKKDELVDVSEEVTREEQATSDKFFKGTLLDTAKAPVTDPTLSIDEDNIDLSNSAYYAPGEMLEGKPRQEVKTPEDWEKEGSAFLLKRGRREAIIESVYSTELDDPLESELKTANTKYFIYGLVALIVILLAGLAYSTRSTYVQESGVDPLKADPFQSFYVNYENPLAKEFPSLSLKGKDLSVAYPSNNKVVADGKGFATTEMNFTPSEDNCTSKYNGHRSICPVAFGVTETGPGPALFYSIDIVHSNLFSKVARMEKLETGQAKAAYSMVVMYAGRPAQMLVIVNNDNSGWALQAPPRTPAEAMQTTLDGIELS